jgi:hypothetical protein
MRHLVGKLHQNWFSVRTSRNKPVAGRQRLFGVIYYAVLSLAGVSVTMIRDSCERRRGGGVAADLGRKHMGRSVRLPLPAVL